MTDIQIRRLENTDPELRELVTLNNRVYDDGKDTVESERHWLATQPKEAGWEHWVAHMNGRMVGNASHAKDTYSARQGMFRIYVAVDPDYEGRGVGSLLYDNSLRRLQERWSGVRFIKTKARENSKSGMRFLEKRGFKVHMREPLSDLDLSKFNIAAFLPRAQKAEKRGYRVFTLTELRERFSDWDRKHYDLTNACMADVPSVDPYVPPTFASFSKQIHRSPEFQPDSSWIAVKDGSWVGLTSITVSEAEPDLGWTGLTGVLAPHRRQGVATSLKLTGLAWALERSLKTVRTDNEENNPMFGINLSLGFQPMPADLIYVKDLAEDEPT